MGKEKKGKKEEKSEGVGEGDVEFILFSLVDRCWLA